MTVFSARIVLPAVLLAGLGVACTRHRAVETRGPATPPKASTMTAEEIEQRGGAQSIERMLEGRISGVSVEAAPGGGIAVRIRGTNSFYGGNEPLYVLDGAPLAPAPGGVLRGLNPYDIESITVLKNPADTGIYGVRGANGVIVIKTKAPGPR
jgi:TonB-dependent SusC/RagA subfamily outer membrane receptor